MLKSALENTRWEVLLEIPIKLVLNQCVLLVFFVKLFHGFFECHLFLVSLVVFFRGSKIVDKSLLVRSEQSFLDGVDIGDTLHDVDDVSSGILGIIDLVIEDLPFFQFIVLETAS